MAEAKQENIADVLCERDVPVEMRDGTVLRCDVWRPRANGRVPALLQRQPYDKRMAQSYVYAHPGWYARHGYGVVVQDSRGRGSSERMADDPHDRRVTSHQRVDRDREIGK